MVNLVDPTRRRFVAHNFDPLQNAQLRKDDSCYLWIYFLAGKRVYVEGHLVDLHHFEQLVEALADFVLALVLDFDVFVFVGHVLFGDVSLVQTIVLCHVSDWRGALVLFDLVIIFSKSAGWPLVHPDIRKLLLLAGHGPLLHVAAGPFSDRLRRALHARIRFYNCSTVVLWGLELGSFRPHLGEGAFALLQIQLTWFLGDDIPAPGDLDSVIPVGSRLRPGIPLGKVHLLLSFNFQFFLEFYCFVLGSVSIFI